ncbi:DUF1285 domain-containing protein [uncultured Enterovirga sp.]|uniref:DUF1285 domain-containing protein n=1 Tax=uncultured Enterovirga sp. TaxID=2026352 RepID=UPI0035CAA9E4
MAASEQGEGENGTAPDALGRLNAALGGQPGRGPAPVERWNPPHCGAIDMRIEADGTWFYMGTPIGRPALVRLFSSVLRRDADEFVLVTPVERVGITVVDAPFAAVEMSVTGEGRGRTVAFRTNVDDLVAVGPDHPLRFEEDEAGLRPYVLVRGGLWARVTRALTYDLVELGEERELEGRTVFGLAVGSAFFPIPGSGETRAG